MDNHDVVWPKCPFCKETMFMVRGVARFPEWSCGCDEYSMEDNYKEHVEKAATPRSVVVRCDQCRFWTGEDLSVCKRYPPARELPRVTITDAFDWCGEWREVTA